MKVPEQERRDWFMIPFILGIGFLCVIIAGQWALHFSPNWELHTDMNSNLDPNSGFLTHRPSSFIEPVEASILTPPGWINVFLTPGASFATGTPFPMMTPTPSESPVTSGTVPPTIMTNTAAVTPTATLAFIFYPSTPSSTSEPKPTHTNTSEPAATHPVLPTDTPTETAASTPTFTETSNPTQTPTNTLIPIPTDPTPGNIGASPDGKVYNLPAGGTLTLGINLAVNGHAGWDLVYYELPAGSGILLDWVIIEIGDGTNWYTVFNWGNNVADTNTNVDFNILSNPLVPEELDQRDIPAAELYNSAGVAINLDGVVPPGNYPYIRITAPSGDVDGQLEVDAIQVLP